jgi:hypothetical protein
VLSVECCGVEAYANRFVIANKMLRIYLRLLFLVGQYWLTISLTMTFIRPYHICSKKIYDQYKVIVYNIGNYLVKSP